MIFNDIDLLSIAVHSTNLNNFKMLKSIFFCYIVESHHLHMQRCNYFSHYINAYSPIYFLCRHSHHNDTDTPAWVLPMQDAGLYTHQRTLDIRFSEAPPAPAST